MVRLCPSLAARQRGCFLHCKNARAFSPAERACLGRPFKFSSSPRASRPDAPPPRAVALSDVVFAPDCPPAASPVGVPAAAPVIILHGLFGSKQNWKTLGSALARAVGAPVHAVDLRNHGESAHAAPLSYDAMVADVAKYIDERGLRDVAVMGHSMGGKVAMALALQGHPAVSKLVVLDVSPVDAPLSRDFVRYLDVMREVQAACVAKRSDADRIMLDSVPELDVRQFLLTNLKKDPDTGRYHFRIPLGIIAESLDDLGKFPVGPRRRAKDDAAAAAADADGRERGRDDATYDRPALVIYGSRARYVTEGTKPVFRRFFPNVRFEELDAGHWVHAEKPRETLQLVSDFLLSGGQP